MDQVLKKYSLNEVDMVFSYVHSKSRCIFMFIKEEWNGDDDAPSGSNTDS